MDDFLGTSIQYAEKQIKLLEKEHAKQMQQSVDELIDAGFLNSDYEGSDGAYSDYEMNSPTDYTNNDNIPILSRLDSNTTSDVELSAEDIMIKSSIADNSIVIDIQNNNNNFIEMIEIYEQTLFDEYCKEYHSYVQQPLQYGNSDDEYVYIICEYEYIIYEYDSEYVSEYESEYHL